MSSKLFLFLLFLLASYCSVAQVGTISGELKFNYKWGRYYPIRMVLTNDKFSATTVIDSVFNYKLDNIPYGVYQLKIETNYGTTGLINLIIKNLVVNDLVIKVCPVSLFKGSICESGQYFMYGKKEDKIYYETGELYAQGAYKISKEYDPQYKMELFSYRQQGLWKFYYKNKHLMKNIWYDNGDLVRLEGFYETGKLKVTGYYGSCKIKEWINYSEDGEVIFKITYDNPFQHTVEFAYLKNYIDFYVLDIGME